MTMDAFSPYTIVHWQLDQMQDVTPPSFNCYLVFWSEKIPLGHLWWTVSDSSSSRQTFIKSINSALEPGLEYYFNKCQVSSSKEWKSWLDNEKYDHIESLLNSHRQPVFITHQKPPLFRSLFVQETELQLCNNAWLRYWQMKIRISRS
jgi:hypothetical protein